MKNIETVSCALVKAIREHNCTNDSFSLDKRTVSKITNMNGGDLKSFCSICDELNLVVSLDKKQTNLKPQQS